MNKTDTIIIGGAPAGLMAAISAARHRNRTVLLLEKMTNAGRKLLITGKGQCNLTRTGEIKEFIPSYGANGRFLKHALHVFTNRELMNFFAERGCPVTARDDRKVFPASFSSQEVLNVLLRECSQNGIQIKTGSPVLSLAKNGDSFIVQTNEREYGTCTVIIATGGNSYPSTGSSGDGYRLAESLGHTIVQPRPALAPIHIPDFELNTCSGIGLKKCTVSIYRNGKRAHTVTAPLLITHTGFSGPATLHLSRYLRANDALRIGFLPEEERQLMVHELVGKRGKGTVRNVLSRFMPRSLVDTLLRQAFVQENLPASELSKEHRGRILNLIFAHTVTCWTIAGYNEAMVTAGGVCLKEIDPKTMQSKLHEGLFFAGEVLDIDGDTGGYNLQAAFSSGHVAGFNV